MWEDVFSFHFNPGEGKGLCGDGIPAVTAVYFGLKFQLWQLSILPGIPAVPPRAEEPSEDTGPAASQGLGGSFTSGLPQKCLPSWEVSKFLEGAGCP